MYLFVSGVSIFFFFSTIYLLNFGTVSDGVVFSCFSFDQYYKAPVSESRRKKFWPIMDLNLVINVVWAGPDMYVINPVKLKFFTNNLYQFYVHGLLFLTLYKKWYRCKH